MKKFSPQLSTNFYKKHFKKIVALIIIVFLLIVIKNIIQSIIGLQNNSQIVTRLQNQELSEKQKEQFLKERLYYVKTQEFIETQARERLGMVKEGEYIVLAPAATSSTKTIEIKDTTPNWKKWLNLVF